MKRAETTDKRKGRDKTKQEKARKNQRNPAPSYIRITASLVMTTVSKKTHDPTPFLVRRVITRIVGRGTRSISRRGAILAHTICPILAGTSRTARATRASRAARATALAHLWSHLVCWRVTGDIGRQCCKQEVSCLCQILLFIRDSE